jgi:hypothetical protein
MIPLDVDTGGLNLLCSIREPPFKKIDGMQIQRLTRLVM